VIGPPEWGRWKVYFVHPINETHLQPKADCFEEWIGSLRPAGRVQQPFLAPPQCTIEPFLKVRLGLSR
jgi:hypothetical protein